MLFSALFYTSFIQLFIRYSRIDVRSRHPATHAFARSYCAAIPNGKACTNKAQA